VYAGVSNAKTVITCQPEPGLQICAKCDDGSSGLPIANTRAFELVAKASNGIKDRLRDPAGSTKISGLSA
jgi:hypothetical protein